LALTAIPKSLPDFAKWTPTTRAQRNRLVKRYQTDLTDGVTVKTVIFDKSLRTARK
jgi:hypothetical protein